MTEISTQEFEFALNDMKNCLANYRAVRKRFALTGSVNSGHLKDLGEEMISSSALLKTAATKTNGLGIILVAESSV